MFRTEAADARGLTPGPEQDEDKPIPSLSIWARGLKRSMDIAGALLFLVLLLPLFVAVAVGVRLSSAGPIFFVQTRAGRGGRGFRFYKFRSMKPDSDDVLTSWLETDHHAMRQWQQFQKVENDPRITPFGAFIRRTSLDEIPQFWNVLKGDMSLVGPRPCMLEQKHLYGPHWRTYCSVKPGITGLWQVSGRNHLTYRERVLLDVRYVDGWSAWQDFKILAKTILVVLFAHGAH